MEYTPYTYLIGWSIHNKWYYGVEYGHKKKTANPENLWKTYFTSSKLVKYFREIFGEPDVIQVRKIFTNGNSTERMISANIWEKKVLGRIRISDEKWLNGRIGGNISPAAIEKINLIRYGVKNVFESEEIKEKIKKTNIKRYGVDHPSKSKMLMERKAKNNIAKYGTSNPFTLPENREKCIAAIRRPETKEKKKNTCINKYGTKTVSENIEIKNKILDARKLKSQREIVAHIREYKRVFNVKLKPGWYQSADAILEDILSALQEKHGVLSFGELVSMVVKKKYSSSINELQERLVVTQIRKYREKYGRKLSLGRAWDRKSTEYLEGLLVQLVETYGKL